MSLLNASKQANNRVKSIVFGYIREHQSSESINIPLLISYKCLTYYFVHEFFVKASEIDFKISNDKMMVTNIGGWIDVHDHTIYCNQWINTASNIIAIAKWTFLMKRLDQLMYIGLASNDKRVDNDFCRRNNGPCYQISNNNYKYSHKDKEVDGIYIIGECGWKCNDMITLILDLTKSSGRFSIQINEGEQNVIFDDVEKGNDIKYKMAVQIEEENDCVILKEYEESYM